ncbi:MAG: TIGR03016 family PEP-CTERM system-associated outer membrane protein, partial [Methylohalobius sp.]|nr:TIGR03016 family PEP-CTERM system-associated outer membrane protein [Methylohalobius sp.]
ATHTYTQSAFLRSGRRFNILTWSGGVQNQRQVRADGQDVEFRSGIGQINYRLTRAFSTFVQGGFVDNQFQSTRDTNRDGLFWTAGVIWSPSRFLTLEAGGGRNSFATVTLQPTRRTLLQGTYQRNNVGALTGNVFQGLIRHHTRRTVWQGQYFETITTSQAVLAEQQVIPRFDAFGNPILDPLTNQPVLVIINVPELVDEVLLRKRGELSFTGNTAKTTLSIQVYSERRIFELSQNNSRILGVSGNWNWRFGARTNILFDGIWQRSDFSGARNGQDLSNVFWTAGLRLNRRLSERMNAYLEYRHQAQSSGGIGFGYEENRVIAALNMGF